MHCVSAVLVTANFPTGTGLAVAARLRYVTSAVGEGLLMLLTGENAVDLQRLVRAS
jgi:hypothetical protein